MTCLCTCTHKVRSYVSIFITMSMCFPQKFLVDPNEVLVTCGDQSDPRITLGVDIAQALTLIFRSDDNGQQNRGVDLTIIEINATAANVSDHVHLFSLINMSMYHCSYTIPMMVAHEEGDLLLKLQKD